MSTIAPAAPTAAPRPSPTRRRPMWAMALLMYAASRVVSTLLIQLTIVVARPGSRIGQHANLMDVLTAWDGQWYRLIAAVGYPAHLPMDTAGVAPNAWAFLPVYPWVANVLSFGDPARWPVTAVAVSVVCGAVAAVLLGAFVRPHVGDRGALITVALFCVSPTAFVLETTYAESMSLALLFGVLLLVDRQRYLAAVPVVVVLAFTRPGLQAIVILVVAVHAIRVWRLGRRIRVSEWVRAGVLTVVALAGGWAWPAVASVVTGVPNAYVFTELAWRKGWTGGTSFQPVTSWLYGADFWFGSTAGPVVLGLIALTWAAVLLSPPARRAGLTVRAWSLAWTAYLLVVFFPQSSVFRLLMPTAPIGAVFASVRLRTVAVLVAGSIALQGIWIFCLFGYWTHYWTVP